MYQALQDAGVAFEYQYHVPFEACGLGSETKRAFVDIVILRPWGHILLEVDEDQRKAYDPSCDVRRDFDIMASLTMGGSNQPSKLLILRYNPDGWRVGVTKCSMVPKLRHKRLLEVLDMEPPASARWFLFYDRTAPGDELPAVAEHWPSPVRELSRAVADQ